MSDLLVDLEHRGSTADELSDRPGGRLRRRLERASTLRKGAIDDPFDIGDHERLADVVEGTRAHRFDRGFERAEPADEDHRSAATRLEPAQQIEPRSRRIQVDVGDQQVERLMADPAQRGVRVLFRDELPPRRLQELLEEPAGLGVIVHDKNSRHG